MTKIELTALDANLIADLGDDAAGYEAFEAVYDGATVSNQCYHIVFNANHRRGGIVFVGSGSSGVTGWTDAASANEVLTRFAADEMVG